MSEASGNQPILENLQPGTWAYHLPVELPKNDRPRQGPTRLFTAEEFQETLNNALKIVNDQRGQLIQIITQQVGGVPNAFNEGQREPVQGYFLIVHKEEDVQS